MLAACGSDVTGPPTPEPVINGSISFSLDTQKCPGYTTAEYVVDSVSVGTEPIVVGALSKSYSVPSGQRSTIARLTKPGSTVGLWTFRDRLTVPANGQVTAHLVC